MTDGFLVPGMLDGMGAFQGKDGRIIVVRNHELSPGHLDIGDNDLRIRGALSGNS